MTQATNTFNVEKYLLSVSFIAVVLVVWKLWRLSSRFHLDPREPPLASSRIPFVGHLIGLMQKPHRYLFELHEKTDHPVSTLRMLNGKVYVINSPKLVQAAFKSKGLSFAPLVNEYVGRMEELSPFARKMYAEEGLHERMMQLFQRRMAGSSLKQMNAVAMDEISSVFQDPTKPQGSRVVEVESLWLWMRDIMTVVTTSTLLAPRRNPWKEDPALIDSYWNWEAGDVSGRAPLAAIKDRASHQGRLAIQRALTVYFAEQDLTKHGDHTVSQMTIETAAMQKQYDFGASDMGAAYTQVIHASLMNVVPTTFWVLVQIFSRPELLATLREEATGAVREEKNKDGSGVRQVVIDINQPHVLFPKLMSAFREAHRLATAATLHRRVVEDTYLSDRDDPNRGTYLLKKGVTIMIPTSVSLQNAKVWGGAGAGEFDPERFLSQSKGQDSRNDSVDANTVDISSLRKKAYFPFGGGKELCPGRNFAIAEVIGIMAVLLTGFDIVAPDGGAFPLPQAAKPRLTTGTRRPHQTADLRARISRRPGWEDVIWTAGAPEKGS